MKVTATPRLLACLALPLLILTGCGLQQSNPLEPDKPDNQTQRGTVLDPTTTNAEIREVTHRLSSGQEITCLAVHSFRSGGLSCDWNHPRTPAPEKMK